MTPPCIVDRRHLPAWRDRRGPQRPWAGPLDPDVKVRRRRSRRATDEVKP